MAIADGVAGAWFILNHSILVQTLTVTKLAIGLTWLV